ncbi:MAG: hypothetical protein H3C30_08235 [Candidatus Hydrogenedentes bacterium]|nr:hypothetical protein [Candidatus Hydrogenedentota bacterium]
MIPEPSASAQSRAKTASMDLSPSISSSLPDTDPASVPDHAMKRHPGDAGCGCRNSTVSRSTAYS